MYLVFRFEFEFDNETETPYLSDPQRRCSFCTVPYRTVLYVRFLSFVLYDTVRLSILPKQAQMID